MVIGATALNYTTAKPGVEIKVTKIDNDFGSVMGGIICMILGVAFVIFGMMFLHTAIYPALGGKEKDYIRHLKNKGA